MSALILREWNNRPIRQREDGYISATDMCQACEKRLNNWLRLDSTEEYLKALQLRRYADLSNGNLIDIIQGGTPENQGTWIHRKISLRLAQWLSPDFAIQVDDWIEELLLKGYVSTQKPKMTLQETTWMFELMREKGQITKDEMLYLILNDTSNYHPQMSECIKRAKEILDNRKILAELSGVYDNESQAMYKRMLSTCIKYADKHSKNSVTQRDLVGDAILKRKDFMNKYGSKKTKQLNKPEIHLIWQEMHVLGMGIFDKSEGTFEPKM